MRNKLIQKLLLLIAVMAINAPVFGLDVDRATLGKVEIVYNADCEGGIKIIPTNPTSCGGTGQISINYQGSNTGDYESRIGGSGSWVSDNEVYNSLTTGEYLVEVRNIASPNEICRSFVVTLFYKDLSIFSGRTIGASTCGASTGSILFNNLDSGIEISWLTYLNRTYTSTSGSSHTISNLSPGTYGVRLRRIASPFCFVDTLLTVGPTNCELVGLCSTTLGENRFPNGDFGSGTSNQGNPLSSSETNYMFTPMSCNAPDDGAYTITSTTEIECGTTDGVFGAFVELEFDHTPNDNNGYMMLVNAAYAPDIAYEKAISNLCTDTEYEFSAWIYNVQPGASIKPNLTFVIDGIGRYTTGNINGSGWQEIGFTFNSSGSTSAVFSIRNNNPGGQGNDWIIDDIFVGICEPEVTVSPVETCVGETGVIASATVTDDQEQFSWYKWQYSTNGGTSWIDIGSATEASFSSNNYTVNYNLPSPIPSSFGGRLIRINVATSSSNLGSEVCSAISVGVLSIGNTEVSISSSVDVCVGEPVVLSSTVTGDDTGITYQWQFSGTLGGTYNNVPSSGTSSNYTVPTGSAGTSYYRVIVVNNTNGCDAVASDTSTVDVKSLPGSGISGISTICEGDNTTLTAAIGDTYLWNTSATTSSITVSPSSNTTYSVTVTNAGSCSTPSSLLVEVISVTGGNIGSDEAICIDGDPGVLGE